MSSLFTSDTDKSPLTQFSSLDRTILSADDRNRFTDSNRPISINSRSTEGKNSVGQAAVRAPLLPAPISNVSTKLGVQNSPSIEKPLKPIAPTTIPILYRHYIHILPDQKSQREIPLFIETTFRIKSWNFNVVHDRHVNHSNHS